MSSRPARRTRFNIIVAAVVLTAACLFAACGDGRSDRSLCVDACKKLAVCDRGWVESEASCAYQCSRPDAGLNVDLAECVILQSCTEIEDLCFGVRDGDDGG